VIDDVPMTLGAVGLIRATPDRRSAVERLQCAAYARNRELLGLEPLPLLADYGEIFRDYEVWVAPSDEAPDEVDAALILDTRRADDILIWSISGAPNTQNDTKKRGFGKALLQCASDRARQLGRNAVRLYTGQPLTDLIDWYARNGYEIERTEQLPDRSIVHMLKTLS
jgi:GNAT superfamily N-acetyltransferase